MISLHGGFSCYAWLLDIPACRIFFQLGIAAPLSCRFFFVLFLGPTLPMLETTWNPMTSHSATNPHHFCDICDICNVSIAQVGVKLREMVPMSRLRAPLEEGAVVSVMGVPWPLSGWLIMYNIVYYNSVYNPQRIHNNQDGKAIYSLPISIPSHIY